MNEKLLTIGEAAEILQISFDTLRRWDKKGILKPVRFTPTGHRKYREDDVYRLLTQNDIFGFARLWATSSSPITIPKIYYCENSDIFRTRYERLNPELSAIPEIKDLSPLISAIIGEMGNNSFDHNLGNWPDVAGIFFGYDVSERKIVLADRGQGILKTLRKVIPTLKTDEEALKIAFTEIITGRAPEGRGNGLKFVKKIIIDNPLRLIFNTGNTELLLKRHDTELDIHKSDFSFHGCMAVLYF